MIFAILIFGLTCWLGLYLLNRNPGDGRLRWAGLGLLAYAGVWAADALRTADGSAGIAPALARAEITLQFLPALCWTGALIYVLPEDAPARPPLVAGWCYAWLPAVVLCVLLGAATEVV